MAHVLAILGLLFALSALVVGGLCLKTMLELKRQLGAIDKRLADLDRTLDQQQSRVRALEATAQARTQSPSNDLVPLIVALVGARGKALSPAVIAAGFNFARSLMKRRGNRRTPAELE
jgi:predicted nucleic acid-binding Zn ribbon protein